jgi:hypothetical protein
MLTFTNTLPTIKKDEEIEEFDETSQLRTTIEKNGKGKSKQTC